MGRSLHLALGLGVVAALAVATPGVALSPSDLEGLGGWVQTAAILGVVGTGGLAIGLLAMVATEIGRYKLFKACAALPLFSRFDKDEVLEHNTREQLYQYIRNNPGPSFSDLRRALDLSNGTLVHHLRILEAQEFVKPVRDGFRTRFYIRGPRVVVTTYLTRTQQTILEAIQTHPGLTQKELAGLLGLPRESVFYHARKLETVGKLRIAKEGKWRRYFPAPEGPEAAAPEAFGTA
jgi:DNA-binding MarR family transcriptional regulator